jgi:lysophospholipase L1-like esterase
VTDARARADTCTFALTVTPPPARLRLTKFVAFGDSITEGKPSNIAPRVLPKQEFPETSYTNVLRSEFRTTYPTQTIEVINEGLGGEKAFDGQTRIYYTVFQAYPFDVLLLLEGVNDLNAGGMPFDIAVYLRAMVQEARRRGIAVFLATLTPVGTNQRAAGSIENLNDRIRTIAATEGAVLVDLYRDFGGVTGSLIGGDGLHPTSEGYRRIEESFFRAIRATLEVQPGAASLFFDR